jgi:hypothetical protein
VPTNCQQLFLHPEVTLHFFDYARRPIKISLLLSGLTSTREVNEICEESQVVLKRLNGSSAIAGSFRGVHPYLVAPIAELCRFDDYLPPIVVPAL